MELTELPSELVATTVIVYDVLTDKLVMVYGEEVVFIFTYDPPFNEYLYVVIGVPPLLAG